MNRYMYIYRYYEGYSIQGDWESAPWRANFGIQYIGYSKRGAIRQFRRDFDMVGKHFTIIDNCEY